MSQRTMNQQGSLIEAIIPKIETKNLFFQSAGYFLNRRLINLAICGSFILKGEKQITGEMNNAGFPRYAFIIAGFALILILTAQRFYKKNAGIIPLACVMFIATATWYITLSICPNKWLRPYHINHVKVQQYCLWLIALAGSLQCIWGMSLVFNRNRFRSEQ